MFRFFIEKDHELKGGRKTVKIYLQDRGMEFGIEKCAMLVMESGKRHMTEGVELLNKLVIKRLREMET